MPISDLQQAIDQLPGTADGIAAYLAERGIRGSLMNPGCCPIANYLAGTGEFLSPDVTADQIDAFRPDGYIETAVMPVAVGSFVYRFDRGEWPELQREATDA